MSIKVTLTANELFRFAMYHIYHARTGIFSLIAGAVAVILAVTRWGSSSTFEKVILCLCIFSFLIWEPLKNFVRSKAQAASDAYRNPITFTFDSDGIEAAQGKSRQKVPWKNVVKTVKAVSLYIIYIDEIRAFLIPVPAVANKAAFEEILRAHVSAERRKGV